MATDPKNLVGVTLLGRYKIERPIGEGGMGAVFEATQLSLSRRVAVKVVKAVPGSGTGSDDDNIKRFERETEAIARLAHPNIVQVVDAGRAEDGTLFLAMELIDGENVRQLLRRGQRIYLTRALRIVEDVASALVAAHAAGVIHRDLKAENIMLVRAAGREETAKVLDFGVAKLTSRTEAPPVTGSGFVAGTPGFIAPEQMIGKSDDARSDLYSIGVLLFEMLTGEGPFVSNNAMELMLR
ncbi:MAG TPA: serine/threonine-protein kinase, partial [Myxococcota bacterium]